MVNDVNLKSTINENKENNSKKIWRKIAYINFILAILVLLMHAKLNNYINNLGADNISLLVRNFHKLIGILRRLCCSYVFCYFVYVIF